jgi:hypothetical protein
MKSAEIRPSARFQYKITYQKKKKNEISRINTLNRVKIDGSGSNRITINQKLILS